MIQYFLISSTILISS